MDIEANAILTFRDPDGREWMAAAHIGRLLLTGDKAQTLEIGQLKDRGFVMQRLTVITK